MLANDLPVATTPGAGAHVAPTPGPVRPALPSSVDIAIVGAGCAGLATAVHLAASYPPRTVVVLEGAVRPDTRSWCSWDDGSDPLPEARSASWDRWEVRTDRGTSTGTDPQHPYVLVRAAHRRTAAERRLDGSSVRVVDGCPVTSVAADRDTLLVRTGTATVRAGAVLDARGPRCPGELAPGRVLLHQRFVGQWITTARPVFDPTTVTLMDFTGQDDSGPVRFVYVLPTSATTALVESTLFTPHAADPLDHVAEIARYVGQRWGLRTEEWQVDEEERGCIPMTDAPAGELLGSRSPRWSPSATVVGTTRPSSGYGYGRSNRHSAVLAEHLRTGSRTEPYRDRPRTRVLDAVFLRFLRDRPEQAAEAFRRLMALPGPLVVRFMTERSTLLDEARIVLALQKRPFLVALVRTLVDVVARHP